MSEDASIIPVERVERSIYLIRGHKVMLDRDLAALYGVETKALNQAVKRNTGRFPSDFVFRLSKDETKELVTICDQFQTLKHSTSNPFRVVFEAIHELMIPPEPKKNPIGFHVREEPDLYIVRKIS